jgi:hypothetical protein
MHRGLRHRSELEQPFVCTSLADARRGDDRLALAYVRPNATAGPESDGP